MALFQPTNITPSSFNGTGTVDAGEALAVKWQVNGSSPMVAYKIVIMQNDEESTEMLDTGRTALPQPFYGTDYKGRPQTFETEITAAALASAGIVNGYENGYKLQITQWWGSTDAQSITQSSASYFITRGTPTVTINVIPTQFTFIRHTFSATYSQAQSDAIEWMRWEIEQDKGSFVNIYDTGRVYGTAELKTTYEGFFPTTTYRVKCSIRTESGMEADSGWTQFTTWYNIGFDNVFLPACPLCDRDAMRVGVPKNMYVLGRAQGGNYTFGTSPRYNITLGEGTGIAWTGGVGTTLNIGANATYIVYGVIGTTETAPLHPVAAFYGQTVKAEIWANTAGIYVKINGLTVFSADIPAYGGGKFAMGISNGRILLEYVTGGATHEVTAAIREWQASVIDQISIFGPNTFYYLFAFEGDEVEYAWQAMVSTSYPGYAENTQFLYIPSGDLYTGSISIANARDTGFSLYRERNGDDAPVRVTDFPIGFTSLYDYGAASQQRYLYTCFPIYTNAVSDYNIDAYYRSRETRPVFWNYTVLTAAKDSEGIYHVISEYRFALDIASGSVGNNNAPGMMQNFTQYPTVQKTSMNYRSGTLTAFIGKVENDRYQDNIDLMAELYALSTSGLTKFLKTRKGDFMMIEVSAPIAMQIGDKFAEQPAKISLPWTETGSTEGVSAVGNAMMADAPYFYVDLVTGELIMLYNPEYVDSGAFSLDGEGYLYLNDPGIYDESDYYLASDKYMMLRVE